MIATTLLRALCASYTATVQGASSDGSRFEQVQAIGARVRRPNMPVFERVNVRLSGVVVNGDAIVITASGSNLLLYK